MSIRVVTVALILATIALWLVWDVVAVFTGGVPSTESFVIFGWLQQYPQLVFLCGFVMGHWTWGQKK